MSGTSRGATNFVRRERMNQIDIEFTDRLSRVLSGHVCANEHLVELVRWLNSKGLESQQRARELSVRIRNSAPPPRQSPVSVELTSRTVKDLEGSLEATSRHRRRLHLKLNRQLKANRELNARLNTLSVVVTAMGGVIPPHIPVEDKKYDHELAVREVIDPDLDEKPDQLELQRMYDVSRNAQSILYHKCSALMALLGRIGATREQVEDSLKETRGLHKSLIKVFYDAQHGKQEGVMEDDDYDPAGNAL